MFWPFSRKVHWAKKPGGTWRGDSIRRRTGHRDQGHEDQGQDQDQDHNYNHNHDKGHDHDQSHDHVE